MVDDKQEGASKSISTVTDLVKAVPIYQDAIQPAAKELGKSLTTVAKTVNLVLGPLAALVWGYEQIREFVEQVVAHKLRNVPPERIVSPSPHVAGPALEALRYTGHSDELRNLYANLLASSLDSETALRAHPAFVDIIKSMAPDEARLMGALAQGDGQRPAIDLLSRKVVDRGYETIVRNFCLLAQEAGCEHAHLRGPYLDNLCRLGLVEISDTKCFSDTSRYAPLRESPELDEAKRKIEQVGEKIDYSMKILSLTDFGFQFCAACVVDHDQLERSHGGQSSSPR